MNRRQKLKKIIELHDNINNPVSKEALLKVKVELKGIDETSHIIFKQTDKLAKRLMKKDPMAYNYIIKYNEFKQKYL